jgi:hypothetical protein
MQVSTVINRLQSRYRRTLSLRRNQRIAHIVPGSPIISFTFDDFPRSAAHSGGAILKRHAVRGTYYVSLGLMNQELPAGPGFSIDDLRQVAADGHELGCHTFHHCDAWETNPITFEKSIVQNKRTIAELIPRTVFKTLSYPISCPRPGTKQVVARHYICSRGGGQTFNVGKTDLNNLRACFLEKCENDGGAVENLIEQTQQAGGWLIFATHDVCDSPTRFGCTPEFFEHAVRTAVKSGAKVLPVAQAWEFIVNGLRLPLLAPNEAY